MYVCMYVCMYACMHTCMFVCRGPQNRLALIANCAFLLKYYINKLKIHSPTN